MAGKTEFGPSTVVKAIHSMIAQLHGQVASYITTKNISALFFIIFIDKLSVKYICVNLFMLCAEAF